MNLARSILPLLFPLAFASACQSWTAIKHTELPKLNGGTVGPGSIVSGTNRGEVVAVSVGHVEDPDGRLVEIEGEFDVRIVREDEKEFYFAHPVRAEIDGSQLVVRGANRSATRFDLDNVESVEVSQEDNGALAAVSVVAGVVLVVVLAGGTDSGS